MTLLLPLALLLPTLAPARPVAEDKPKVPTPAEQYRALEAEYHKKMMEGLAALRAASATPEGRKAVDVIWPDSEKFAQRFFRLAEEHPNSPAGADALVWVVSVNDARVRTGGLRRKALNRLLEWGHASQVNREKLIAMFRPPLFGADAASQAYMKAVLEKNASREVRGTACCALAETAAFRLGLASALQEGDVFAEEVRRLETAYMGADTVAELRKADVAALQQEAVRCYRRLAKDFADLPQWQHGTMGKLAALKLEVLRRPIPLGGKPAPEIVGQDVDGKALKLSDYRGKVVLLCFWGHWCGPCRALYPYERAVVSRLAGRPFALVGVNSDRDRKTLREALVKEKITWPSFYEGGSMGPIASQWGVHTWPSLYLIDHNGTLRKKLLDRTEKALDAEIEKLVREAEATAK